MELIADILLAAGALGAGFYCIVLSRRLSRFTDLEQGVGGAIAVLSAQVDDMTKTLVEAQKTAASSGAKLGQTTERAEAAAKRLELLIASMHDLPEDPVATEQPAPRSDRPTQPDPVAAADDDNDAVAETVFLSQRSRVEAAE